MEQKKYCTLMYHDVYDTSNRESGFNIDSNYQYKLHVVDFEAQVSAIDEYIETFAISKDYVRISFDDGGVSFYHTVMPILEKYGFKGYFFISTKFIGLDGFLTESMIKEMSDRGHIIGGHSHSHRQRMNDLPYSELKADWKLCLDSLTRIIGKPCTIASLPNGYTSKSILQVLKELGVTQLYTSEPSEIVIKDEHMEIFGRYGIKNTMCTEDVIGISFNESVKSKLRWKKAILNFVKKLMGKNYVKIREYVFKHKS